MNLIDLVKYFQDGGSFEDFCIINSLNSNSEVIEIFMEKPFSTSNKLVFIEIEKTEGKIQYNFEGKDYFELLDFYLFKDLVYDLVDSNSSSKSTQEIAERIMQYAINDA